MYPEHEGSSLLYRSDSRYSHIEVRELERAGRSERILIQDALIHNRYDPSAPDDLLYEYEQIFAALTRRIVEGLPASCKPRTLTLGGFLNAYLNTLRSVFENVQVYTDSGFSSRRRATFVILAGCAEIHGREPYLYDEAGNVVGRHLEDELLVDLREKNGDTQLTDVYAPVENLIAPVFLRAVD